MKTKHLMVAILLAILATAGALFGSVGDGAWLAKVPSKEQAKRNPFDSEANAIAAGGKLFRQYCSKCHGTDASGSETRPNLHSERVRAATPGQLQWLLTNGSMRNGMPAWSHLPEQQRWQIVSFIKSLPVQK